MCEMSSFVYVQSHTTEEYIRQVLRIACTVFAFLICGFGIFEFFVRSLFRASKMRPRTVTQPFVTVRGRHFWGRQADPLLKSGFFLWSGKTASCHLVVFCSDSHPTHLTPEHPGELAASHSLPRPIRLLSPSLPTSPTRLILSHNPSLLLTRLAHAYPPPL